MTKRIIIGGKDRDHYRGLSTAELLEQVHYGIDVDWKELSIALTERLKATRRKLDETRYDIDAERYDYDSQY